VVGGKGGGNKTSDLVSPFERPLVYVYGENGGWQPLRQITAICGLTGNIQDQVVRKTGTSIHTYTINPEKKMEKVTLYCPDNVSTMGPLNAYF
jgi:hypothetical protein